jgi:CBS domain-containing protein
MEQRVAEVMARETETLPPTSTVAAAAARLEATGRGALPVFDAGRYLGLIVGRDAAARLRSAGRDPATTPVVDALFPERVYAKEEQGVEAAVTLMNRHKLPELPVLNRDGRLVGRLVLADVAPETAPDAQLP